MHIQQNFNFKSNVSDNKICSIPNQDHFNRNKKKYLRNNNNCNLYGGIEVKNNISKKDEDKIIFNHNNFDSDIVQNNTIKTEFFWENLNQKYPFNHKLKYCVFFNGCCCPPHKGHIASIKEAFHMLPGCKVIINQLGSSVRHGVPSNYNSELLQKYLSVVFNNSPNIKYMFRASNKDIFTHDFVTNCDVLIIIRGDEVEEYNKRDIVKNINKKNEQRFSKYIKKLNNYGIKVDFYMQYRNVNKVSATKFIEKLNEYKNKLYKRKETNEDLYMVMDFIPEEIDFETRYRIVKTLLKFDTWTHRK